jgi:hypothetical protein
LLEKSKRALVRVEDPLPRTTLLLVDPTEPLLVRLESFSNIIEEKVSGLPSRPITETYKGSTKPIFGDDYRTPIHPTTAIDTHQTHSFSVWRNPLGHDLCEHFEYIHKPLNPHDTPAVEAGPFGQTIDHPIE